MILELFKNNCINNIKYKLNIYSTQKYFIFKFITSNIKKILLLKNIFESLNIDSKLLNYKRISVYFLIIKIKKNDL